VQATNSRPRFEVVADAQGVCSHVGAALLAELADRLGLTEELGRRANRGVRAGSHDRGAVLRDLVVMLADGGDCVSDLRTLRQQPELFGEVCSASTAWRVLVEEVGADPRGTVGLWSALARVREHAWALGAAPTGPLRIDLDATLIQAHSDKQGAAGTYKGGLGSTRWPPGWTVAMAPARPLPGSSARQRRLQHRRRSPGCACDGAAGPAQVATRPADPGPRRLRRRYPRLRRRHRRSQPVVLDRVRLRQPRPSRDPGVARAGLHACPGRPRAPRPGAWVAELAGLDLASSGWPEGTRAICRRERPHPGARHKLGFTDAHGHRFQVFITNQPDPDPAILEARHRPHAHVEDRIRTAKATGLRNLPLFDFDANDVWLTLVIIAQTLVCWAQALLLDDHDLKVAEPKTLRYRLWHVAGRIVHHARRMIVRLDRAWPWASELAAAFTRLRALPARC
jgi:hypothetical protein